MEPILLELTGGSSKWMIPTRERSLAMCCQEVCSVHLAGRKYWAKKGESFYYKPNFVHYISNAGKTEAKVLWVSTPPSFPELP